MKIKKISIIFLVIFLLVPAKAIDFSVSSPVIKVVSDNKQIINNEISIINLGKDKEIKIDFFSKEKFISVDKNSLYLNEGSSGFFLVSLNGTNLDEGVYIGKINLVSEEEIIIPVVLEVQTPFPLFDIALEGNVLNNNEEDKLNVNINVYKLKGQDNDVVLNYFLEDTKGNILFSETQKVFVSTQTEINKIIELPQGKTGDYVFYVLANDKDLISTGTSSLIFSQPASTKKSETSNFLPLILAASIILFLILAFIIFNHYWNKKIISNGREWKKKLTAIKNMKTSDTAKKIEKLESQKTLLEISYQKKYITKKSYEEGRKKIEEAIKGLKCIGS